MSGALPQPLIDELLAMIVAENVARSEANAAEPYRHEVYAEHEARIDRLVAALADGDEWLDAAFSEALFDITYDGLAWARRVWSEMVAERAEDVRRARMTDDELCAEIEAALAGDPWAAGR